MTVLLEVCVDSADGLAAAVAGGADRIELCAALEVGGLTPSVGLMRHAAGCGVPVFAMIRPRAGDFGFGASDAAIMRCDIAAAGEAGLAGVVLGATSDGRLDAGLLAGLCDQARAAGLGLTLHRAFDACDNPETAMEAAIALGFARILTSGGAASAADGVGALAGLFRQAAGRIGVMPGVGVSAQTIGALRHLPLREVHGSCSDVVPEAVAGFGGARATSVARVRALKAALAD